MYKVLIVDDEKLVIKGLKASIDWQEYGFSIEGEIDSSIEALEYIKNDKPDLVFTDVRMPEMNGLELVKQGKALSPQTEFVIVSGYAEFAYAQKAMGYGAIGYCLKPFDDDEIIHVLKKAAEKLARRQKAALPLDLILLDMEADGGKDKLMAVLRQNGILSSLEDPAVLVLVSVGRKNLEFPPDKKHIFFKTDVAKYVYLMDWNKKEAVLQDLTLPEDISSVGIGGPVKIDVHFGQSLEKVELAAYQVFMTGRKGIYMAGELFKTGIGSLVRELEESAGRKDIAKLRQDLKNTAGLLADGTYTIRHAYRIYNVVMSLLYRLDENYYDKYVYHYEQLYELFKTAENMMSCLADMLEQYMNLHSEYLTENVKNKTFRDILADINQNFCQNISMQGISQKFCINPSYLSQMFRKEIDMTFTQYLTRLRISYACVLLKNTMLPINDISEKVGFNDYFYFSKAFKQITGKTPGSYRNAFV